MSEPKTVYVLGGGEYSDYAVFGVYPSLEAAKAAAPPWPNVPEIGMRHPGAGVLETLHDWRALQLEGEELEVAGVWVMDTYPTREVVSGCWEIREFVLGAPV